MSDRTAHRRTRAELEQEQERRPQELQASPARDGPRALAEPIRFFGTTWLNHDATTGSAAWRRRRLARRRRRLLPGAPPRLRGPADRRRRRLRHPPGRRDVRDLQRAGLPPHLGRLHQAPRPGPPGLPPGPPGHRLRRLPASPTSSAPSRRPRASSCDREEYEAGPPSSTTAAQPAARRTRRRSAAALAERAGHAAAPTAGHAGHGGTAPDGDARRRRGRCHRTLTADATRSRRPHGHSPRHPSHTARAHSFNTAAAQYAANRPSYPPALFDAIEELAARPLARLPRRRHRRRHRHRHRSPPRPRRRASSPWNPATAWPPSSAAPTPHIPIVRGDGNALPLATASVDFLTYAQSWHWTDPARSVPEALRVLRPGGALALWWNTHALDVPWITGQPSRIAALPQACDPDPPVEKNGTGASAPSRPRPCRPHRPPRLRPPPDPLEPQRPPRHPPGQHRQPLGFLVLGRGGHHAPSSPRNEPTSATLPRRNHRRDLRRGPAAGHQPLSPPLRLPAPRRPPPAPVTRTGPHPTRDAPATTPRRRPTREVRRAIIASSCAAVERPAHACSRPPPPPRAPGVTDRGTRTASVVPLARRAFTPRTRAARPP